MIRGRREHDSEEPIEGVVQVCEAGEGEGVENSLDRGSLISGVFGDGIRGGGVAQRLRGKLRDIVSSAADQAGRLRDRSTSSWPSARPTLDLTEVTATVQPSPWGQPGPGGAGEGGKRPRQRQGGSAPSDAGSIDLAVPKLRSGSYFSGVPPLVPAYVHLSVSGSSEPAPGPDRADQPSPASADCRWAGQIRSCPSGCGRSARSPTPARSASEASADPPRTSPHLVPRSR